MDKRKDHFFMFLPKVIGFGLTKVAIMQNCKKKSNFFFLLFGETNLVEKHVRLKSAVPRKSEFRLISLF